MVALGGSAGALPTMVDLLERLRWRDHACLFLIYHRAGDHDFDLNVVLRSRRAHGFTAQWARDGLAVAPNMVYYPYRSEDLEVVGGRLRVRPPEHRHRPNIDRLFQSLARTYGPRLTAALLSGTGRDGLAGLRAVRAAGGATVVQDPADAPFAQLPEAAVAEGLADEVLSTAALLRWAERVLAGEVPGGVPPPGPPEPPEPPGAEGPPRAGGPLPRAGGTKVPERPSGAERRADVSSARRGWPGTDPRPA